MTFKTRIPRLIGSAALLASTATVSYAQSQVQLYGFAASEVLHVTGFNAGTAAAPSITDVNRIDNSKVTTSRFGLRGSEDLGAGLAAIFQLESGIQLDTGAQGNSSKLFNRGSWVGLKSNDYGALTLGRQYDLSDGMNARYFQFGGYSVFQFSEFAYVSDVVDNAVKYVSPTMGGVSVRALYGAGEKLTGDVNELAVNYINGNFETGASYRTAKNLTGQKDRQSTLGVSYQIGAVRLHVGLAKSDPQALGMRSAKAYDIGAVWDYDARTTFTYDRVNRDQSGSDNDSYFDRLQGIYRITARTAVFANLVRLKNKGTAAEKFYGSGAAGVNQTVYSLGIQHAF